MTLLKILSLALLLTGLVAAAWAAEGDELWQETFGGTAQDRGYDLQITDDGGYILAGYTLSMGEGGRDVYLVKLDAAGELDWQIAVGSAANDLGNAVIPTSDGGFLAAGRRDIGSHSTYDALLVKVDADGVEEWQETYGGSGEDEFFDVVECATGGYAMVGVSTSFGAGGHEAWVVRVDADGVQQWQNSVDIGGHGFDYLQAVVETAGGHLVATGYSGDGVTFPEYDAKLVRFNATGGLVWNHTFDRSTYDRGYAVASAPGGGFVFAGPSASGMTIWRTDDAGYQDWVHSFQTVTGDNAQAVIPTSDGGFLVGGATYNYDDGLYQMYVGKTDADGQPLWERLYGGAGNEGCVAVGETPAGHYALMGTTDSEGAGGDDLILIEVEGPGDLTATGDLPLAGLEQSLGAHPNPFNPLTVITFELAQPARADLSVMDARGRLVRTLTHGELLAAGPHQVNWDGRDDQGRGVPSGTYVVRARAGSVQAGHKVMLLK